MDHGIDPEIDVFGDKGHQPASVESLEESAVASYKNPAVALGYGRDTPWRALGSGESIVDHIVAVETVDPHACTEPYETSRVFEDGIYKLVAEAVIGGERTEFTLIHINIAPACYIGAGLGTRQTYNHKKQKQRR